MIGNRKAIGKQPTIFPAGVIYIFNQAPYFGVRLMGLYQSIADFIFGKGKNGKGKFGLGRADWVWFTKCDNAVRRLVTGSVRQSWAGAVSGRPTWHHIRGWRSA